MSWFTNTRHAEGPPDVPGLFDVMRRREVDYVLVGSVAAAAKGVKTVLGTGAEGSTYAHGTQGLEFVAFVKQGGMTPSGALQAGTIDAAEMMQWQNLLGWVF